MYLTCKHYLITDEGSCSVVETFDWCMTDLASVVGEVSMSLLSHSGLCGIN